MIRGTLTSNLSLLEHVVVGRFVLLYYIQKFILTIKIVDRLNIVQDRLVAQWLTHA